MSPNQSDLIEKIRQQFDFGPYPRIPLNDSPQDNLKFLHFHCLTTPYYLRYKKKRPSSETVILDVGCGTGYKSLGLAYANPGAKIVGVDLSEKSVNLARKRLEHYDIKNAEFHAMSLYDLPETNFKFDYINCDEVLSLLPDLLKGFLSLKAVLKPDGIIRANLHSLYQRAVFYRGQNLFKQMGFTEENPEEMQIDMVVEMMQALKDNIDLKQKTWTEKYTEQEIKNEAILMNFLLMGDRGYTVPDLFNTLQSADLELIQMVNWRQWQLENLFKEPDNLPIFLALSLPEATLEEKLTIFELLHPVFRLLDFWCGHPTDNPPPLQVSEWTEQNWSKATVHLHPLLHHDKIKNAYQQATQQLQPLQISDLIPIPGVKGVSLDITIAACLFPALWESPQPFLNLLQQWQTLQPIDLTTFQPTTPQAGFALLQNTLTELENSGYILLEQA